MPGPGIIPSIGPTPKKGLKKYSNKAIEINKKIPQAYLSKSIIQMQQGKNDFAIKTLGLLIKNIPEYALAYVQRGLIYNSLGKYEMALQDLNKFLEIVKKQKQRANTKEIIVDIKKKIKEIENKIKK